MANTQNNPARAFLGDDAALPPTQNRTGNFMYGTYLFLLDELTDLTTFYAIADLTRFVSEEANWGKTLTIVINSCGGSVFVANTIIGLINQAKYHDMTVTTIVYGWAASAASMIAIQGDTRIMSRNALHFIHFGIIPTYLTKVTEITKSSKYAAKLQQQAEDSYLKHCKGLTQKEYLKITEDEMGYVFSEDCIRLGLCDTILEDELESKQLEDLVLAEAFKQTAQSVKRTLKNKTKESVSNNKTSKMKG